MSKAEEYEGLKNGSYFHITNRDNQQSLTFPADLPNATLHFATLNENRPDQIWMIEEVQPNKYEIVHAYTTFVLTTSSKGVKLNYGYQSSDQLFFLQKSDPKNNPLEYWIK
jgi:tRNA/tmRNA/rRNA uracil-C5-methylase (TrmA/RlmC/RlmD family)